MIDRQYGLWMDIWDELTIKNEKKTGYNELVGKGTAPSNNGAWETPYELDKNNPNINKLRLFLATPTIPITLSKLNVISANSTLNTLWTNDGSLDTLVGDFIFFRLNKSLLRSLTIQINKSPPIIFTYAKPNKYDAKKANIILNTSAPRTPHKII